MPLQTLKKMQPFNWDGSDVTWNILQDNFTFIESKTVSFDCPENNGDGTTLIYGKDVDVSFDVFDMSNSL